MGECDYCNHKGELYLSSEYNDWEDNVCEPCWREENERHIPLELEDLER